MSFFRAIAARRSSRPAPAPWLGFHDAESFAYALMRRGTDTDEARELLRQGRPYFLRKEGADDLHARWEEGRESRREATRYAALGAANRLLREAGYRGEEPEAEASPPIGHYYAGPDSEWLGIR